MEILIGLILLILLIYLLLRGSKHINNEWYNAFYLIIFTMVVMYIVTSNRSIGVILILAILIIIYNLFKNKYLEHFDIVEDDVDKIIEYDDDSLLGKLRNKEDKVTGVWGCSYLGKGMGLCKG